MENTSGSLLWSIQNIAEKSSISTLTLQWGLDPAEPFDDHPSTIPQIHWLKISPLHRCWKAFGQDWKSPITKLQMTIRLISVRMSCWALRLAASKARAEQSEIQQTVTSRTALCIESSIIEHKIEWIQLLKCINSWEDSHTLRTLIMFRTDIPLPTPPKIELQKTALFYFQKIRIGLLNQ